MKIIITEEQYNKLRGDGLRKFLHSIWDKQKKLGEQPMLDDVIYDVTGIRKGSTEDVEIIRPIWYDYNGGEDFLFNKLVDEIDNEVFKIKDPLQNLNTTVKVVNIEPYLGVQDQRVIQIMVDVDGEGTINIEKYDEDGENYQEVNTTIYDAYGIAKEDYETDDLMRYLRNATHNYLNNLLEKYGFEIDVEVDIK